MASPPKITGNRANAQKSTGPRSVEGKSASRFNALKHGIDAASVVIPGEDPAEYEALAADYRRDFRPQSPSEIFHVDTMLRADWLKRRLQLVEAISTAPSSPKLPGPPSPPRSSPSLPRPNSSPACSARSPPSNALGTALIPNSAVPALKPNPPPNARCTPANWLRSRPPPAGASRA